MKCVVFSAKALAFEKDFLFGPRDVSEAALLGSDTALNTPFDCCPRTTYNISNSDCCWFTLMCFPGPIPPTLFFNYPNSSLLLELLYEPSRDLPSQTISDLTST